MEQTKIPQIVHFGFLGKFFPFGFWYEFKQLTRLAGPIAITSLITYMSGIISAIFCGQLSKSALATVGLALAYFNITGLMIIFGLLTAAETLFTQTFGSEKKYLMGTQLQRALVISTFCTVLCASANFLAEPIFLLLKQNPLTAKEAAKFLLYMIPGLWFAAFGQVFTKYVQSQNHQYPPMIIGIIVNGLNAALHYWLLFVAQIGVRGSAIAQVVMYAFQSLILLGYTIFLERNSVTWQGLSWDLWMEWGTWFRLAIPGVFMLTMEFLIFEIGSFGAGALGETELAVQTILFNVETVCYALLPQGFGMATTIRLGQFLGAGSSAGPRSVLSTALVTMWVAALVVTSLLILLRKQIPLIFTTNSIVVDVTAQSLPIIAAFQIFDGTVGVCSGAVRGAGLQKIGAVVSFVCLYLIGAPVAVSLVLLTSLGVKGIWVGLLVGIVAEGTVYLITCYFIDWDKQVVLARNRIKGVVERMSDTSAMALEDSNHGGAAGSDDMVDNEIGGRFQHTVAEINDPKRLTKIVLSRTLFVVVVFIVFTTSICLKSMLPWRNYFGQFCVYFNETYFKIENIAQLEENCSILTPGEDL